MNPLVLVALLFFGTAAAPMPDRAISETDLAKDPTISRLIQKIAALNDMLDWVARDTSHPETSPAERVKALRRRIRQAECALKARRIALGWQLWSFQPLPLGDPTERPFGLWAFQP